VSKYVGDRVTEVVHLNEPASQQCPHIRTIPALDRVYFVTLATAHMAGYQDCPLCLLRQGEKKDPQVN
jgi:hypothetical protein